MVDPDHFSVSTHKQVSFVKVLVEDPEIMAPSHALSYAKCKRLAIYSGRIVGVVIPFKGRPCQQIPEHAVVFRQRDRLGYESRTL